MGSQSLQLDRTPVALKRNSQLIPNVTNAHQLLKVALRQAQRLIFIPRVESRGYFIICHPQPARAIQNSVILNRRAKRSPDWGSRQEQEQEKCFCLFFCLDSGSEAGMTEGQSGMTEQGKLLTGADFLV